MALSSKGQHLALLNERKLAYSRPLSSVDETEIPRPAVPVKRHQLASVIRDFMTRHGFWRLRCA